MVRIIRVLFLFALAALPSLAATVYTDSASFLAVLEPGSTLETFSSIAGATYFADTATFPGFSATADAGLWGTTAGALSVVAWDDSLVITFTGSVTAVGATIYGADEFENIIVSSITVTLSDGTTQTVTLSDVTAALPFIGFTTSGGVYITSLTLTGSKDIYSTIDDLYIGQLATTPTGVPEPASLTLVGGALLGLAAWRWRSRERA